MLWPALRALSHGDLPPDQFQQLLDTLDLEEAPRTEGPGMAKSIAHRSFTGDVGTRLVVDLARTGESGWVLALFFDGQPPASETVEGYRAQFRDVISQAGLTLIEITPAATADEVYVAPPAPSRIPETATDTWDLPYEDLDQLWPHVGLRQDASREVKAVKLREVMSTPAWAAAPDTLRSQAEAFLKGF